VEVKAHPTAAATRCRWRRELFAAMAFPPAFLPHTVPATFRAKFLPKLLVGFGFELVLAIVGGTNACFHGRHATHNALECQANSLCRLQLANQGFPQPGSFCTGCKLLPEASCTETGVILHTKEAFRIEVKKLREREHLTLVPVQKSRYCESVPRCPEQKKCRQHAGADVTAIFLRGRHALALPVFHEGKSKSVATLQSY
jgi:hypothetical protein